MARSRNIKPGYFKNPDLAECQPLARILFAGCWCWADRDGRLEWRPKLLKVEILPYDDCDVDELVAELVGRGFVRRYSVDGREYADIPRFSVHQNPHKKELAKDLPGFSENAQCLHGANTGLACEQHSTSPADSLLLIPDSLSSEGEPSGVGVSPQGNGFLSKEFEAESQCASGRGAKPKSVATKAELAAAVKAVVAHYAGYHPKARPGDSDRKLIAARLAEGYSADDLKAAIDGCHRSPHHCGENASGTKYQSLALIVRDAGHVAQFIETPRPEDVTRLSQKTQNTVNAGHAWAAKNGAAAPGENHLASN